MGNEIGNYVVDARMLYNFVLAILIFEQVRETKNEELLCHIPKIKQRIGSSNCEKFRTGKID